MLKNFFISVCPKYQYAGYGLRKEKEKNHDDCGETKQCDCDLALTPPATHATIDLEKTEAKEDDREC